VFRICAVILGVAPVLITEMCLRLVHWHPALPPNDPFIEFESTRPLFVLDDETETMVTATNRLEYFRPESFAADKPLNEYRIVCIGGSTVQGRPYAIETSFTTWLELSLRAADPSRNWDVINCGGVSYASYRLVPIVEEMLQHEPDLIVLYTGHNEFLEDRHYLDINGSSTWITRLLSQLNRLRSAQLVQQLIGSRHSSIDAIKDKPMLVAEVDALLDYQGGLESYQRDPEWRGAVVSHFGYNMRRMIQMVDNANVPLLLIDPPVNLRDCPPFKSVPTEQISTEQRMSVVRLVADAADLPDSQRKRAIGLLEQAVAIDPANAGTHFLLATLLDRSEQFADAKYHFERSLDEDICPLRITSPLRGVIRDLVVETDTPLIEIRSRFEELSTGTIPGKRLFVDHVHPTFYGHQLIAEKLMQHLQVSGVIEPIDNWQTKRDAMYEQHWSSLDVLYFERGKQRLEGLQLWSQGRADKIRETEL
jgi:lysophospholipase L1-like esterase